MTEEEYSKRCPRSVTHRISRSYVLQKKNGAPLGIEPVVVGVSLWLNFDSDKAIELPFGQCIRTKIQQKSEERIVVRFTGDKGALPWMLLGMNRTLSSSDMELTLADGQ